MAELVPANPIGVALLCAKLGVAWTSPAMTVHRVIQNGQEPLSSIDGSAPGSGVRRKWRGTIAQFRT
jgi:hypothetical protein